MIRRSVCLLVFLYLGYHLSTRLLCHVTNELSVSHCWVNSPQKAELSCSNIICVTARITDISTGETVARLSPFCNWESTPDLSYEGQWYPSPSQTVPLQVVDISVIIELLIVSREQKRVEQVLCSFVATGDSELRNVWRFTDQAGLSRDGHMDCHE